jgi:hypothetical protein
MPSSTRCAKSPRSFCSTCRLWERHSPEWRESCAECHSGEWRSQDTGAAPLWPLSDLDSPPRPIGLLDRPHGQVLFANETKEFHHGDTGARGNGRRDGSSSRDIRSCRVTRPNRATKPGGSPAPGTGSLWVSMGASGWVTKRRREEETLRSWGVAGSGNPATAGELGGDFGCGEWGEETKTRRGDLAVARSGGVGRPCHSRVSHTEQIRKAPFHLRVQQSTGSAVLD